MTKATTAEGRRMEEDSNLATHAVVSDVVPRPRGPLAEQYRACLSDLASRASSHWKISERDDRGFVWRSFDHVLHASPEQGWKIHVTCAAVEVLALCELVLPRLLLGHASFKLPATLAGLMTLNDGDAGPTQLGKVLTVYPVDDAHAVALAKELDRIWPSSRGPRIPTDLMLRPRGAVGLRYGVISGGHMIVKANGSEHSALRAPDGGLVIDERVAFAPQPAWAPPLALETVAPSAPSLSAPVHHDGLRFVPLALLHSSPRGRVRLAIDMTALRRVVLKSAEPGVTGDERGRDAVDRLRDEHAILAALPPGVGPRALHLLERDDETILVLEDLGGSPLCDLPPDEQRRRLPEFARQLASLHAAKIAHRDVKLRNAIATESGVRLIDFELAETFGTRDVTAGGTPGHVPPEGTHHPASEAADAYALGAAIAGAYLEVEPGLLPNGVGRLAGLMSQRGATEAAAIVKALGHPDPARRIAVSQAADRLDDAVARAPREPHDPPRPTRALSRFCVEASVAAALATETYRQPAGPFWRIDHSTADRRGVAIANGASGILLGLASIDEAVAPQRMHSILSSGGSWLAASRTPDDGVDGLWVGGAGVALCLGVLGRRLERPDLVARSLARLEGAGRHESETDLYTGSAGIAWAACLLAAALGTEAPLEIAETQARRMMARVRLEQGVPVWEPGTLVGETRPLFGAAHGAAGAAVALAAWGRACNRPEALTVAVEILRGVHRIGRTAEGGALRHAIGSGAAGSGDWCHGAAGYLWAMLAAFGDDADLSNEIDWAVGAFDAASRIGTPTYCHGLAGQLELWQMLRAVPRHAVLAARRADEIVRVLRAIRQRREGVTLFGAELPDEPNPSLWVGFLGPATALARYAEGRTDALLSPAWLSAIARPRRRGAANETCALQTDNDTPREVFQ